MLLKTLASYVRNNKKKSSVALSIANGCREKPFAFFRRNWFNQKCFRSLQFAIFQAENTVTNKLASSLLFNIYNTAEIRTAKRCASIFGCSSMFKRFISILRDLWFQWNKKGKPRFLQMTIPSRNLLNSSNSNSKIPFC